jgi:lipopolysaccharide/colanic/teichoic acid biosynthesis glycosyltransferase
MTKRWCDIAVAGTALLLAAPVVALAAAAIRLSSRGPVLYVQERIGRGGRPFRLYKLRTMIRAASGAQVTAANDARVTGIGRLLRRTKIDELPQLWNVLRGDMTLIGPRPEVERYVRQYNPEQRRILAYVPGLASLAQLMYPQEPELLRTAADPETFYVRQLMPRKVAVDLAYERERTVWTDLRLIADILLLVAGRHSRIDRSLMTPPGGLPNER